MYKNAEYMSYMYDHIALERPVPIIFYLTGGSM